MKIGNQKIDLSIKHICFTVEGKEHFIAFRFSHRKGIQDVYFDSREAKIIDAYPPLTKLIRECASIILHDMHTNIRKIAHKMKDHNLLV